MVGYEKLLMGTTYQEKYVISVGGSLIVPNSGINTDFLKRFNIFIRTQLAKHPNRQFFLVTGGGATCRHYRDAALSVVGHELTAEDQDWLGIHSSRLNAHLVRTIFQDIAHPNIIKHYDIIRKVQEPVVVAAGWRPGWSTDYCAVLLCADYQVTTVLNLSNINQVYDKDPNKFPDAKPIEKMSRDEMRVLVGDEWKPGMHAPFDPVAAKKAEDLGVKVVVVNGADFENLENCIEDRDFVGTVIS